jgi:hypothetical protein
MGCAKLTKIAIVSGAAPALSMGSEAHFACNRLAGQEETPWLQFTLNEGEINGGWVEKKERPAPWIRLLGGVAYFQRQSFGMP